MSEKGIVILPRELVKKINANRGDMSQASFIEWLIDSQLKHEFKDRCVSNEEVEPFEQDMKKLLKSFLDFFVNYGLELGKRSPEDEFEELTGKLKGLQKDLDSDSEEKKATIKWK